MPTITTGTFFAHHKAPQTSAATNAEPFKLVLSVLDNQGPIPGVGRDRKEFYEVTWRGPAAENWWREHGAAVKAGTALRLQLINPQCLPGLRAPVIHAHVQSCELAPARVTRSANTSHQPQPHAA